MLLSLFVLKMFIFVAYINDFFAEETLLSWLANSNEILFTNLESDRLMQNMSHIHQ